MMNGQFLPCVLASATVLAAVSAVLAAGFPNDDRRLLYNSDSGNAFSERLNQNMSVDEIVALIHDSIDELAAAQVDTFSIVTSVKFFSRIGPSKVMEQMHRKIRDNDVRDMEGWRVLDEAGVDARKVMADRCHEHGMEFVATIRMNDRHGGQRGRIIRDNPDWILKGLSGGPGVDFAQDPVRELLLDYVEEVLATVEVDGIEFDYMRWAHMFQPGEGAKHAHLLTDMMRKARKLLDDAARRRGRSRLILIARVPQTFKECAYLGYDLKTWIREGLVDALVPSDFFFIDYNTPVAELVEMARGTRCRIYPSVSPPVGFGYESLLHARPTYRAAAHSFFAAGASGVQVYNYQYHWRDPDPGHRRLWPAALKVLTGLKSPDRIAPHDRHYLFFPLWSIVPQTGFVHDDRIRLDRAQQEPQGRQPFRLYEDLTDPKLSALLRFKAVGLLQDESLHVHLNGQEVDRNFVERREFDGQGKELGKVFDGPFAQHTIRLGWQPPTLTRGENELRIHMNKGRSNEGTVTIDDLEVYVYVRP